jgi:hypothetical protein
MRRAYCPLNSLTDLERLHTSPPMNIPEYRCLLQDCSLPDGHVMTTLPPTRSECARWPSLICEPTGRQAGVSPQPAAHYEASAFLHDITKTRSFETRENHAETGDAVFAGVWGSRMWGPSSGSTSGCWFTRTTGHPDGGGSRQLCRQAGASRPHRAAEGTHGLHCRAIRRREGTICSINCSGCGSEPLALEKKGCLRFMDFPPQVAQRGE